MKLVLIDRDGVINEELPNFVKSADELHILPQALEAFALLKRHHFTCVIITNQSVVGRGIISEGALERIHNHLEEEIKAHGGKVDSIFACTDHPDRSTYRRKPGAGMLIEALEKYGAQAARTPFIGDSVVDMQAALAAGCPRYLVMTGKGHDTLRELPPECKPVTPCMDILDAARRIVTMPEYGAA